MDIVCRMNDIQEPKFLTCRALPVWSPVSHFLWPVVSPSEPWECGTRWTLETSPSLWVDVGIRSQMECVDQGWIVHVGWGVLRSSQGSGTQEGFWGRVMCLKGGEEGVQCIYSKEELKGKEETSFLEGGSCGWAWEDGVPRRLLKIRKQYFILLAMGEPLKNSEKDMSKVLRRPNRHRSRRPGLLWWQR